MNTPPLRAKNYTNRRGYRGEAPVRDLIAANIAAHAYRPRAGARNDMGDIGGIPVVVSIKNYAHPRLSLWVDELAVMVQRAGLNTGVVWHKRVGKGQPDDWYVTTNGALFLPLLAAYLEKWERDHVT